MLSLPATGVVSKVLKQFSSTIKCCLTFVCGRLMGGWTADDTWYMTVRQPAGAVRRTVKREESIDRVAVFGNGREEAAFIRPTRRHFQN